MRFFIRSSILVGLFIFGIVSGYAAVTYTPAHYITLTGSTDLIRFDLAATVQDVGSTDPIARLDSTTSGLEGAFYIENIGWGTLKNDTYHVDIDCGGQALNNLGSDCKLTGSGWSETIGELGFSRVIFHHDTGALEGFIQTNVGDISVTGIYLPLHPSTFTVDMNTTQANNSIDLQVANYIGFPDGGWQLLIEPHKAIEPRIVTSDFGGKFAALDFSLADTYTLTLTDMLGSTTRWDASILPGNLSLTLTTGDYFLHTFCTHNPDLCPDGATLKATTLSRTGDNLVADGQNAYIFTLKSRDTYGNLVNVGTVDIAYKTTITTTQIETDTTIPPDEIPLTTLPGSAVLFPTGNITNTLDGKSSGHIHLAGQDIQYSIASIAPSTLGEVSLESIIYTSPTGSATPIAGIDTSPLTFQSWFGAHMSTPVSEIQAGEKHEFRVGVTNNSSRTDVTPQIITFFNIGNNAFAGFRDFVSTVPETCQAYVQEVPGSYVGLCNWGMIHSSVTPSILVVPSMGDFVFTGSYAPMSRYPIKESVNSETLVSYQATDALSMPTRVTYRTDGTNYGISIYRDSRLKILGENTALGEYGDISLGGNGKTKYFDTIRKNISLLTRNRSTYTDVPYTIIQGDYTVTDTDMEHKRTLIVIGGNLMINSNISLADESKAFICLSNTDGIGGVITINPSVTDIHASLITDRHVTSSGDKQLYIHGSLISSNTLGDTLARICPYYVSLKCDETEAAKYDLEKYRENFSTLADKTGKRALSIRSQKYPDTAIIIEHDDRTVSNPPPGL